METEHISLSYPIGRYQEPEFIEPENIKSSIEAIEELPELLYSITENLDDNQLLIPYRPGGWNSKQVIHHIADSHLNAFIRFKLSLTEKVPVIKPYEEADWAKQDDYNVEIISSLKIIEGLHHRWVVLMNSISPQEWERSYFHPQSGKIVPIKNVVNLYAWHGKHHAAQISSLKERMGW